MASLDETERTFSQAELDRIVGDRLARDRQARVKSEPAVYGLHSPHSYYADLMLLYTREEGRQHAQERMGRYARELGSEMERGTPEGQRAERIIRARLRVPDESEHETRARNTIGELRALSTGGGITATGSSNAAAFVTPAFLTAQFAPFRGAARAFADQCHTLPLPPFGLDVYIPFFGSAASVKAQTEGGAVTESSPSANLEGTEVQTISGQIIVTQQLRDRAFAGGGSMDVIINQQLHQQYDERVDIYAINRAVEQGKSVTGAGSFAIETLYADLAKGREEITDSAGVRLRPTHLFTSSDFFSFVTRQVDTTNKRPIVVPEFAPGFPISSGADDYDSGGRPKWSRFSGSVMPGGVLWFLDDNIATFGTTSQIQILVSAPGDAIVLMEDEPALTAYPETKANELKVVLNLRSYVAAVTRHAGGTASISGGGYLTSQV